MASEAEQQLLAISPVDGRYANRTHELAPIVSEYGLIRYRAMVEIGWLKMLGSGILPDVPAMDDRAMDRLDELAEGFDINDALRVKEIEATTNHDVKSVEMWLRDKLAGDLAWAPHRELIHFGATSEDITNLSIAMMVRDARDKIFEPNFESILGVLTEKAQAWADIPILGHTHGQPASPTTLGKEVAVFVDRLARSAEALGDIAILGKFNGATGNHNALAFAYPEVDWGRIESRFVQGLGFDSIDFTTQIDPHDWQARFYNELALSNTILTDLAQDMWLYISKGYLKQAVVEGEVGSSTMPHKVNPIDFENSEANFGAANATLNWLARKLPISRLQRDLSDSSAQRTIGTAFGHTQIAHRSLLRGLGKVSPNEATIGTDLEREWSVLTEAVQTVMRRHGVEGAYELIKTVSRGQALTADGYRELIESIDLPEEAKQRLRELTPATYTGTAKEKALGC